MPFDCELIREGLVAQPVNTASSLAFVAAAVLVWPRHRFGAVALAWIGVGSVLFHAQPSWLSSLVHDSGLVVVGVAALAAVWSNRRTLAVWPFVVLATGLGFWAVTRTGGPWCSPDSVVQGHALWHVWASVGITGLLVGSRRI